MIEVIRFFIEVRQHVGDIGHPIAKDLNARLNSEADCEDLLDVLCGFWEEVSVPVYFREVVEYQNAVLRFQVRTQKVSHVRMVHQHNADGRLLLDIAVLFDYGFILISYDHSREMERVKDCFRKVPNDFYKRRDMEIIPVMIYDNNSIIIDKHVKSRIEAVRPTQMQRKEE